MRDRLKPKGIFFSHGAELKAGGGMADEIVNRKVDLVINTPLGRESFFDDRLVRRAAMMHEVPCITTLTGAAAAVSAIRALRQQGHGVRALQDYYAGIAAGSV